MQVMPASTTFAGANEAMVLPPVASISDPTLTMLPVGLRVCHAPDWTTPFCWPVPEVPETSQFL